jgi:hypothetical protein
MVTQPTNKVKITHFQRKTGVIFDPQHHKPSPLINQLKSSQVHKLNSELFIIVDPTLCSRNHDYVM